MSLADDTYGASLLAALGVANVVAELGPSTQRYPEVELAAVTALEPDLVLAPSEPYAFRPKHVAELAGVAPVLEVDGQDLFWWGVRTPAAAERLHRVVAAALDDLC
jgi:ABC-type hemin transport system substrate-binding protein